MKIALALALVLTGCESVPDLHFDTVVDGSASEAGPDDDGGASSSSGSSSGDCPSDGPSGARCCGGVWCVGDCTDTNCNACGRCGATGLCCGKGGNAVCKTKCP